LQPAPFEWDEENVSHIARRQIEPDETEAVLDNHPLILRTKDDKYLAYGPTDEGRLLLVVFVLKPGPLIRVITCGLTEAEKKRYRRRRR
jgi:uncharacterized DUF497 family protein